MLFAKKKIIFAQISLVMAIACQIIIYKSYSDRGAFMFKETWKTSDVDEAELKEGETIPNWPYTGAPVVDYYDGYRLDLTYEGKSFSINAGDEVMLAQGSGPEDYGVICTIQECIKLLEPTDEEDYIDDDGRYDAWT